MSGKKSKISIEDYLHFFQSHKQFDLATNFLSQIIRMHGFKSNCKGSKKVLIDVVDKSVTLHGEREKRNIVMHIVENEGHCGRHEKARLAGVLRHFHPITQSKIRSPRCSRRKKEEEEEEEER